jgi:hypothetical protein
MSRLALTTLALTLALFTRGPSSARAQEEDARRLFERGSAAVHDGRFADARVDLERSLALEARAATAFNLVVALRGMGQLVDTGPICEGLSAERYGPLSAEQRDEAQALCSDARAGVAHLTVNVTGRRPSRSSSTGARSAKRSPARCWSRASIRARTS